MKRDKRISPRGWNILKPKLLHDGIEISDIRLSNIKNGFYAEYNFSTKRELGFASIKLTLEEWKGISL